MVARSISEASIVEYGILEKAGGSVYWIKG
jgi:hypothetical protein